MFSIYTLTIYTSLKMLFLCLVIKYSCWYKIGHVWGVNEWLGTLHNDIDSPQKPYVMKELSVNGRDQNEGLVGGQTIYEQQDLQLLKFL